MDDRRPAAPQLPWKMFGAGLAVSLGNPKIMVFYLAPCRPSSISRMSA